MAGRKSTDADRRIGARIREYRMLRDLSQDELGQAVGLSFQQIQKYERGTNRISAGRLLDVAAVLDVPIGTFYDGLAPAKRVAGGVLPDEVVLTAESLELARLFQQIKQAAKRRQILAFVRTVSES